MRIRVSFFAPALTLAILGLLAGSPAVACTCFCDSICDELGDCCFPGCGGPIEAFQATVTPLGQGKAIVTLGGALTTNMLAGSACLTAFPSFDGVAQVDAIRLVNTATGEPIYSFASNELSATSVQELIATSDPELAAQEWLGFHAVVPVTVPDGVLTQFALEVTLAPGANYRDLVRAVDQQVVVAGSADVEGALDFHHAWIRSLDDADVRIQGRGVKP